jgi:hypothetical protein
MKAYSRVSGSEVLLGALAIRLAALVLTGSILLLLLPRQPRAIDLACVRPLVARTGAQVAPTIERLRVGDALLDDMLLHD